MVATALMIGAPCVAHATEPIAVSAPAQPQVKDDLLAGTEKFAKGASDVTDVNLDPSMMSMLGTKNAAGQLAHRMNFIVVRSYTYDKPGMYRMEDFDAYRQKLMDGSWSCFIHVHESESGESTDICNRKSADNESNEIVIMTAEPKEVTFVHMKGRMSLDDLSKMGSNFGAPSTDGLQKRDK
jgi:hypothetical protein